MNRLRLSISAALALTALVLFSTSGSAAIVPQHSIAGIKLGLSERAIKAKLGAPLRVQKGTNLVGRWHRLVYPRVTIAFQNGDKATLLLTNSAQEETESGVGVGSTLKQVRAGLNGEKCKREFGAFHCWTGRWVPGRIITEFRFKHSRVSQVAIGRVID